MLDGRQHDNAVDGQPWWSTRAVAGQRQRQRQRTWSLLGGLADVSAMPVSCCLVSCRVVWSDGARHGVMAVVVVVVVVVVMMVMVMAVYTVGKYSQVDEQTGQVRSISGRSKVP